MKNDKRLETWIWFCLGMWAILNLATARSGRYTVYVDLLIVLCIWFTGLVSPRSNTRSSGLIWVASVYIFLLTLFGFWQGNFFDDVLSDIVVGLGALVVISLPGRTVELMMKILPKASEYTLWAGIPMFFLLYYYMDYQPGTIETARFKYNDEVKLFLYAPILMLQPAYLLLFFTRAQSKRRVLVVAISLALIAYMGVVTLSLHTFFTIGCAILMYSLFVSGWNRGTVLVAVAIIVSAMVGYRLTMSGGELSVSAAGLETRLEGETGFAGRLDEQAAYFEDNSLLSVIVGRGAGGTKVPLELYESVPGPAMLHFGWAHLVMKGGIPLLIAIYGIGIYAILVLWRTKHRPYSVFIVFILGTEVVHTHWMTFNNCGVFWVCVALAMKRESFRDTIKQRSRVLAAPFKN